MCLFVCFRGNLHHTPFPQKLKKEMHNGMNGETNGEMSNGEKTNGEKTNGEKTNGEKTNGEKTNGEKHEDSPPPVKKQKDSSLADIEEAIPDTTMDQKIIDRVLDKTRCVCWYISMILHFCKEHFEELP